MTIRIEVAGRTHTGLVRQRNEDAFYAGRSLFAVADGLGGHVAGNIASGTAIKALQAYDRPVEPSALATVLTHAVNSASKALRHRIQTEPKIDGMGTTLVAMLCSGTAAVLANVGDSRAYLLRGRNSSSPTTTRQITEDHTYEHLVANATSVPNLPPRLSRFLDGRADGRSPDLIPSDLRSGDRYLLCSDGLSSYVPYGQIHDALHTGKSAGEVAGRLVALALGQGGLDNITVLVIDVVG